MKKNYSAIIFSMAFLLILIRRWEYIQCIDRAFYFVAIIGFFILAIGLNYNKIQRSWICRLKAWVSKLWDKREEPRIRTKDTNQKYEPKIRTKDKLRKIRTKDKLTKIS